MTRNPRKTTGASETPDKNKASVSTADDRHMITDKKPDDSDKSATASGSMKTATDKHSDESVSALPSSPAAVPSVVMQEEKTGMAVPVTAVETASPKSTDDKTADVKASASKEDSKTSNKKTVSTNPVPEKNRAHGGGRFFLGFGMLLLVIAVGVTAYLALNNPVVVQLEKKLQLIEVFRSKTQETLDALSVRMDKGERLLEEFNTEKTEVRAVLEGLKKSASSAVSSAATDISVPEEMLQVVTDLQDRINTLESGLNDLKEVMETVKSSFPSAATVDPSILSELEAKQSDLAGVVTSLRETLHGMEGAQSVSQSLAQSVVLFGKRLDDMQKQVNEREAYAKVSQGFLLAATQLAGAVERGDRFTIELKTVRNLAPSSINVESMLESFAAYADKGIPTKEALLARFPAMVDSAMRATILPDDNQLLAGTVERLSSLVSVRRVDAAAEGDSAPAVLARAEAKAEVGDLIGATAEIATLNGAPAEAAKPWLTDATVRLSAQENLSALAAEAVAYNAK